MQDMKTVSLLALAQLARSHSPEHGLVRAVGLHRSRLSGLFDVRRGLHTWHDDLRPRHVVTTRPEKDPPQLLRVVLAEVLRSSSRSIRPPRGGDRERYDVTGTINGHKVRGKLTSWAGKHVLECRRSNNSTRYEVKCSGNSPTWMFS